MIDALIAAAGDYASSLTVTLHTPQWPSFRDARAAALHVLGPPHRTHEGASIGYLEWDFADGAKVQLWTPVYRTQHVDASAPPEDLAELLQVPVVPDAD